MYFGPSDAQSVSDVQAFEQAFPCVVQPPSVNTAKPTHESPELQSAFVLQVVLADPCEDELLHAPDNASNVAATNSDMVRGSRSMVASVRDRECVEQRESSALPRVSTPRYWSSGSSAGSRTPARLAASRASTCSSSSGGSCVSCLPRIQRITCADRPG